MKESISRERIIPFASPLAQYQAAREQIDVAVLGVLSRGSYILGEETSRFEAEFADFLGLDQAIGVASGTDSLILAMKSCGLKAGDEVITTPHTAVATVAAIESVGATAVLADIDPDSLLLDIRKVEARITPHTRAIVLVHLYGQPADAAAFAELAKGNDLWLIEDCAQAHGASIGSRRVGTFGHLACFSFYPTKNLGACGDGGLVGTNDPELADRVRSLREYGWSRVRYVSEVRGMNSRLDELQAAILRVKLRRLQQDNDRRRHLAQLYDAELAETFAQPIKRDFGSSQSVCHLYVVRSEVRDRLQQGLRQHNIGSGVHYPVPIHLQPAYCGRLGRKGDFPMAELAASEVLSLPMYPELDEAECHRVAATVRDVERELRIEGHERG